MQNQVLAQIEIEDEQIAYYHSVIIRQRFNEHHEFSIRIRYDVLEKTGAFKLSDAQKKIGKLAIIKLFKASDGELAYEFRGLICEIGMEQAENFTSDLVLKGYSPTILLENGPHFLSFYKKSLQQIVQQLTAALAQCSVRTQVKPQYKKQITYICQYRESTFHFLNCLSADFGEWCYYDGIQLYFGKPASAPNISLVYGEDVQQLQTKLRILPLAFSSYAYLSKDDKVVTAKAPKSVDGLDQYASFALNESHNVFAEPVSFPVRQRVNSEGDLKDFVQKKKTALAADLEVLSGSSDNPTICIGAIADVKISRPEQNAFAKEDLGKFLITGVEHYINENGKYYNVFEGIPSGIEVIPVKNTIQPIAEPQIATVTDNKDPDNMGRVRVQMLWQQAANEMTDWLRVMTPDAGGGKDGAKNRGLVVVPEPGDQVLLCFRYNDPDRPFVMGSMFHGKTGGGGGQGNNTKSLTSKSGHTVTLNDGGGISIIDKTAKNKIEIDGTNAITVTAALKIVLTNGKSSLTMEGDTITLTGAHVVIGGSADARMNSGAHGIDMKANGEVNVGGVKTTISGSDNATLVGAKALVNGISEVKLTGASATVNGDATMDVSSSGPTSIQGAIVKLN
ncbi:Uncharacterized conserved protein, implicated in type VI secretion and phage assembly [Cnuella takakiae]|uniref:Uncharacterized conserved protein, implicated in type VI secretion and phage assembly n=1 Tax=Cnuella takakiae TaxID=1302690 RepID=A0A1M4SA38_9BACT|nr:phage baseplate assembly protein V [Cnuella takakiae]OLY94441.1 hypothetical protein BUE76_23080 [Cnuella takakiae]SHE29076.1 Uncharacterized conserved protein, implicated in type VI secretion and phage assembly [Cnuella takakiae]